MACAVASRTSRSRTRRSTSSSRAAGAGTLLPGRLISPASVLSVLTAANLALRRSLLRRTCAARFAFAFALARAGGISVARRKQPWKANDRILWA
jgi:hypothetical protein